MRRAIRAEEQCEKSNDLCLNDTDGGGSKRNRFGRGVRAVGDQQCTSVYCQLIRK